MQMFMMSHATGVNHERADRRWKEKHAKEQQAEPAEDTSYEATEEGVPTYNGKPITECTSAELKLYYGGFFQGL